MYLSRKPSYPTFQQCTLVFMSIGGLSFAFAEQPKLVLATVDDFCEPRESCAESVPACPPGVGNSSSTPMPMTQVDEQAPRVSPGPSTVHGTSESNSPTDTGSEIDVRQFYEPSNAGVTPPPAPAADAPSRSSSRTASSLASNTGSRGGLDAPNMFGDFLGQRIVILPGNVSSGSPGSAITVPTISNQRFKISENVSPIPRDNFYLNFNTYTDSLVDGSGENQTLYRYQVGAESAIFDELFSLEFRMSIADGFDSSQNADFGVEQDAEFGNLQLAFKTLLYSDCKTQVGTGLTLALPTADDVVIEDTGSIANESVFIGPFVGVVVRPNKECFFQGFLQTDLTLGGDTVFNSDGTTAGIFQQQNFIYTSLSMGRWLYYDQTPGALINGLAGLLELHYSTTTNDADSVTFSGVDSFMIPFDSEIGTADSFTDEPNLRSDFVNVIAGMVVQRNRSSYRLGIGSSLRGDDDRLFDVEYQLQYNRSY